MWTDSLLCLGWYAGLREEAANDSRPFRRLIYVKPEEHLDVLVERLVANEVSSAPCLTTEPDGKGTASTHTETHLPCCACWLDTDPGWLARRRRK